MAIASILTRVLSVLVNRLLAELRLLYMTSISIEAYHGTTDEGANSILAGTFNESVRADEWLGHGIYFFVDGISDPLENSIKWATAQAGKDSVGKKISVLKSVIDLDEDKILDITDIEGLNSFNDIKEDLFDKIFEKLSLRIPASQHNCMLFNFMVDWFDIHAVKHNLYIKPVRERKLKLRLNVPNTTVLCVRKENFKATVTHEYSGEIK